MFHKGDRIIPLARFGNMSHGQLEDHGCIIIACRQVTCTVSQAVMTRVCRAD